MNLIKTKPITNGQRHIIKLEKQLLSKNNRTVKALNRGFKQPHGRSTINGRITNWHKGGGHKRLFKNIENDEKTIANLVTISTFYDPFRTSLTSLIFEIVKKKFFFSLTGQYIYSGSLIKRETKPSELKLGFRNKIRNIPAGSIIHNLQPYRKKKASMVKAGGTSAQIIQMNPKTAKIKLPSGKITTQSSDSLATLGVTSNVLNNKVVWGKAGTSRNKSRRPIVRGIAMNPVDHPHGGRTNGGRPSVTPWGLPTKGKFRLK